MHLFSIRCIIQNETVNLICKGQRCYYVNQNRDYFFDNYKALLIVLVVVGHFIEPCYDNNVFLSGLKWMIFSFHMPAFIFISGYFSKREISFGKLVQKLVIPYFVYELIYYFLYVFIIHKETGLYFARPKFSLWYIMALFFWRLVTPYLKKIPGHIFIAVTAGLLVGMTELDNFFSIPRILVFFPFFLAGYHFERDWFEKIKEKAGRLLAVFSLYLGGCLALVLTFRVHLTPKIFYGRYSYEEMDTGYGEGILVRLACYGVSFLAVFLISTIISRKPHGYSRLGQRTMPIYLFHGLVYSVLSATPLLESVSEIWQGILLIVFCLTLSWLLSMDGPNRFVTKVSSFPVPSFFGDGSGKNSGHFTGKSAGFGGKIKKGLSA